MFGQWAELFRPFIESEAMYDIYKKLKEDGKKEVICPGSDSVFRLFATSSPDDVKSIWYLMDPYPRRYKDKTFQATGIAMDCSNSPDGKLQPSLEKFYDAMSKDVGIKVKRDPRLDYLTNQGVLLANTDLTVKLNKTNSHGRLWEPFQEFFLGEIMGKKTGIIYVLAGKESIRMEKFIQPLGNYIFKIEHPAAASHKHTDWDCKHIFTRTNKLLKEHGKKEIMWNRNDWSIFNEPPF